MLAALPLAVAVVLAGGALALAPLALLLIPIVLTGRAPGVDRLDALRSQPPPRRLPRSAASPRHSPSRRITAGGLLIAASLSKRGPPLAC